MSGNYGMGALVVTTNEDEIPGGIDAERMTTIIEADQSHRHTMHLHNTSKDMFLFCLSLFRNMHTLLIYFSAHGCQTPNHMPCFWLKDGTMVNLNEILAHVPGIPYVFIIVDACRVTKSLWLRNLDMPTTSQNLMLLFACPKGDKAYADASEGSAFTKLLYDVYEDFMKENRTLDLMNRSGFINFATLVALISGDEISPKFYASRSVRNAYSKKIDLLRSITKQTQDSVIATRLGFNETC